MSTLQKAFLTLFVGILLSMLFLTNASTARAQAACTSKFPIPGTSESLLYCSNKDLATTDDTVKRLIIVIHGTNRNADTYFDEMSRAAEGANSTDSLIIAPRFTMEGDVSDSGIAMWTNDGWKSGDPSETAAAVSSYTVLDEIIKKIIKEKKFPNLQRVILTGHSAGGQVAHRYTAGTQIEQTLGTGISIRYIIANPSSYLYFTPERPVPGAIDQFAVPTGCSDYDTYKYGINDMNPYMTAVGAERMKTQYKDKNVIYLLGDQDTDPNDSSIDTSCAGVAQGAHRFERGSGYYNYIGKLYGQDVYTRHIKAPVPGVAHDGDAMYNSEVARQYLFDAITAPSGQAPTNVNPTYVCAGSNSSVCNTPTPSLAPTSIAVTQPIGGGVDPTDPVSISAIPSISLDPGTIGGGGSGSGIGGFFGFLLMLLGLFLRLLMRA